ncbi:MAG: hypothetical protein K0S47_4588 [Herbinix sp.]|nr:hypothetical protein [Herbinix sp.]
MFIMFGLFVLLGLLFGATEAILYLTLQFSVRLMLPYAVALALLIFAVTAIIAIIRRDLWNGLYIRTIMIAAAVFLIFAQILVGSMPMGVLKVILAFIGSTSFWVMLMTYIGLIFHIVRRNNIV